MGIEDEVYSQATPAEIAGRTGWYTSLGEDGKEIFSRDAWGGGKYSEEYAKFSPSRYCILAQIHLEPILKRRAVELNPDGVHYGCEVLNLENQRDCVAVRVCVDNAEEQQLQARYVLVADGGRMFTDQLGVKWLGERNIFDMVSAHFRSPLRSLHPDPRNFITWFTSPDLGGSTRTGYLYQIGPWPSKDPKDDEWVFACALVETDPKQFDEATMIDRLKRTVQIPNLPVDIVSFSHWNVNCIYAERWRVGRTFLVGDAAHRIPPWGALGMNSGIQDGQNLVWKLELALQNESKYDKLLDTYETERLPVGRRVGLTSLHNLRSHSLIMDKALGIDAEKSPEENWKAIAPYFDPNHSEYSAKRAAVEHAQKILNTEFKAPGYEVGWFYPSADIDNEGGQTHGGQRLEDGSLVFEFYFQSTIPGHHLPHVWLEKDGKRVAIRDLLVFSRLTLFVERHVPEELADERVSVNLIGSGGWHDVNGDWRSLCGVAPTGGVLVRPDGIVAWRGELEGFTAKTWTQLVDRILLCS